MVIYLTKFSLFKTADTEVSFAAGAILGITIISFAL